MFSKVEMGSDSRTNDQPIVIGKVIIGNNFNDTKLSTKFFTSLRMGEIEKQ